jgi:hypothetical protein
MGFLIGSDMQANGKVVMPLDIHGSKFINCIRLETILCRKKIAMLIMAAMLLFPWGDK